MIIKLNIPLDIQIKRAEEVNMDLESWQIMILDKVNRMRNSALRASEYGKYLIETGNIKEEDILRMQKKMQSAFPPTGDNYE